ncbi:MAG: pyridoxamine 5'-phosphate oxidase family protein [Gammaproteobacteria bacterium]
MPKLTDRERDEFMRSLRYGILTMQRADGSPVSVPVWFDWTGEMIRMFALATSPKIARLKARPEASLLVVNNLDEKEAWVAFDGPVAIMDDGGIELAETLAARYWDLSEPRKAEMLEEWRAAASQIALLELRPEKIRSYKD